jgi:uncharacterized protein YegP (UPF0339 family)
MRARFETYRRDDGQFGWRLLAGNAEPIAGPVEGFTREADAERAARTVVEVVVGLVEDVGTEELVEVYRT